MKTGVDAEISARVKKARAALTNNILKVRARSSSMRLMSLVKRLRMRPVGVVSKKLIGDRKIA